MLYETILRNGDGSFKERGIVWYSGEACRWAVSRSETGRFKRGSAFSGQSEEASAQVAAVLLELLRERGHSTEAKPRGQEPEFDRTVRFASPWLVGGVEAVREEWGRVRERLDMAGLSGLEKELRLFAQPCAQWRLTEPVADTHAVSRLGGKPSLDPALCWPTYRGVPLDFVAQLLVDDEVAAIDHRGVLPAGKLLAFFSLLSFVYPRQHALQGRVLVVDPTSAAPRGRPATIDLDALDIAMLDPGIARSGDVQVAIIEHLDNLIRPETSWSLKSAPGLSLPVGAEIGLPARGASQEEDRDDFLVDQALSGPEARGHRLLGHPEAGILNHAGHDFLAAFASEYDAGFNVGDGDALRFFLEDIGSLRDGQEISVMTTLESGD